MHVAGAIKSGQINLEHSYKYRSLDEYLISRNRWDTEKKDLLRKAELDSFEYCKPVLKQLENASLMNEICSGIPLFLVRQSEKAPMS